MAEGIFHFLTHFFACYGYWAIFFGVMLENAGVPVPGETVLLFAGFLAYQGDMQLGPAILVGIAGATIGDNIGYALGRYGGSGFVERFRSRLPFFRRHFDKARVDYEKYGPWSVFLARFITVLRIFSGLLAGSMQMPFLRFFAFNFSGAVIWAPTVAGAGYLFGSEWQALVHAVGHLHQTVLMLAGLAIVAVGVIHYLRRRKASRYSNEAQQNSSWKIPQRLSSIVQLVPDFESFKQQESTFVLLNMFVLAILLLIHTIFSSYWGEPSKSLISILAGAFLAQGAELIWLQTRQRPLGGRGIAWLSWSSIGFNILLALMLAEVTNRPDTQYFILLVVPVLVAAFRLTLVPMLGVVAGVDVINIFWVWYYGRQHLYAPAGEYFEALTVSLIYTVVGVLVWLLVNDLREKERKLTQSLGELERARERAHGEEKLAAVGRLASAIAHEIRNPVAAIVSAVSTAERNELESGEREEMFAIAAKEANRLEKLTTDFLAYARPRGPQKVACSVDDTLGYVADVCRPRASEKGVTISKEVPANLTWEIDAAQVHQALINLLMNAVEASAAGGHIRLRAQVDKAGAFHIEVENDGNAVPPEIASHIFEPFFTTKATGTGLGLAIARNVARAHGGDLALAVNQPGRVCFCMILQVPTTAELPEVQWAGS